MGIHRCIPWFKICVTYRKAPEVFGWEPAPPTRSTYLRISRLPARIGDALDDGTAPFRVYRFVAWGSVAPDTIERRYEIAVQLRRERQRWPAEKEMHAALAG